MNQKICEIESNLLLNGERQRHGKLFWEHLQHLLQSKIKKTDLDMGSISQSTKIHLKMSCQ